MNEKKIAELRGKQVELRGKMSESIDNAEEFQKLEREYTKNKIEIESLREADKAEKEQKRAQKKCAGVVLRELLASARDAKSSREVTLVANAVTGASIEESGAVNLTVKDIIPTLEEGGVLNVPGFQVVTGVTGNELYPVSINDVEAEEIGEAADLTDQDLKFDQIVVTPGRVGMSVTVSNEAIDNAAFDLLGFVRNKFKKALDSYLAKKVFSQAAWTGIKGAFSGITPAGNIVKGAGVYASILNAVAAFTAKGFDANKVCLVVGPTTEAELKATPKAEGQGGFVVENGKLAGYDYVVNHYIDTELDDDGALVPTSGNVIGIGYFDYLSVQQHGNVRLTVDATSKGMAVKNCTGVVLNTAFSITDLSTKINGSATGATQAFAVYNFVAPAAGN